MQLIIFMLNQLRSCPPVIIGLFDICEISTLDAKRQNCVHVRSRSKWKKRIVQEKLAFLVLLLECSLGICVAVWFSCGKDNMLAYIAGGKSRVPFATQSCVCIGKGSHLNS